MHDERGPFSPEQATTVPAEQPHFVFTEGITPENQARLEQFYQDMLADPDEHLRTLDQYKNRPYSKNPEFSFWEELTLEQDNPRTLVPDFDFDSATRAAIEADRLWQEASESPERGDGFALPDMRIEAFRVFLELIQTARRVGSASLEAAR